MKIKIALLAIFSFFSVAVCFANKKPSVLVFTKTAGFYHESIPTGKAAVQKLGAQNNFNVDTSSNADVFTSENLKQYNAIIFLSTTGTILNDAQKEAVKIFVNNGGGFVGIHAAADTEYDWPWYNGLVGAYFLNHPEQQKAKIVVQNKKHIATKHLPEIWERFDEWYNYKSISDKLNVLLTLDEKSYKGGKNGAFHPIAWYQEYDGGRSFYTGLGHTKESYSEPLFLQHLLGGIRYAMGIKK